MALLKNKTNRDNFLVVSRIFLQDQNLSLTERGLLATLHSLPDNWNFTIKGLATIIPDGEAKIKKAIEGLIEKGYLRKSQSKNSDGTFGCNLIEVYERPIETKNGDKGQHTELLSPKAKKSKKSKDSQPLGENPLTENPLTDKPLADKPLVVSATQYNTNELNIKRDSKHQSITKSRKAGLSEGEIERYRDLIAKNIHLDWLLDVAGTKRGGDEARMVNEVYEIICDYVCFPKESVKIKDTVYPGEIVKSQFLKLEYQNVASVLNRILEQGNDIKNMTSYLVSMLYTERLSGTISSNAEIYDDYLNSFRGHPYE